MGRLTFDEWKVNGKRAAVKCAGDGIRTRDSSLGSSRIAPILRPRDLTYFVGIQKFQSRNGVQQKPVRSVG